VCDALDVVDELVIEIRFEQVCDLCDRTLMDFAQIECADRGVEEVIEKIVGEIEIGMVGRVCFVQLHARIVACFLDGTRGKLGSAIILRTGVVVGGSFFDFGGIQPINSQNPSA
tara:strand:- start:794885 stop:795226 length:342 start_codon:yes stop_codon:yes gene_type:complete